MLLLVLFSVEPVTLMYPALTATAPPVTLTSDTVLLTLLRDK